MKKTWRKKTLQQQIQHIEHQKSSISWLVWLMFMHVKCTDGYSKEYQYMMAVKKKVKYKNRSAIYVYKIYWNATCVKCSPTIEI